MKSDNVKKGIQRAPHRSLLRACGLDDEDFKKPFIGIANSFTDVVAGEWYEAPINWAVGADVTNGISDTVFGISQNCNRAQAVTFLYRALVGNADK